MDRWPHEGQVRVDSSRIMSPCFAAYRPGRCPEARLSRRANLPEMVSTARPVGDRSRRSVGGLKSLATSRTRSSLSHHRSIGLAQLGQLGSLKPQGCLAISPRGASEIEWRSVKPCKTGGKIG